MPATPRVAVFRALQLGDMLAAIPALRALRAWQPHAHFTLVGLPWAHAFAERFAWIDAFLAFPGHPDLPERRASAAQVDAFYRQARGQAFDFAIQLHGSGRLTNALVAQLGAHAMAGFHPADRANPDPLRFLAWPEQGREVDRLIALPLHLGAPAVSRELELPITRSERDGVQALVGASRTRPRVIVHPGARLPSRRWPAGRFAAVAQTLQRDGCEIVLTGSAAEADTLAAFRAQAPKDLVDLAERTDLGALAALIDSADLLVCNDTGVSHIAAARGTPSVVVSCGGDAARWAPSDAQRHRVLAADVPCRPCSFERCPTAHECALAVEVDAVVHTARRLLASGFPRAA